MPEFRRKLRNLMGMEDKAALRDDENTKALFSRCEVLDVEMLHDEDRLDRGDFLIARVVLKKKSDDEEEEKFHDHWVIVDQRNKYDIDVLFITDITKNGEKATKAKWEFTLLEKQMEEGTLQLLRFNLLDIQDPDDEVVARANNYIHNLDNHRAMHYAYLCTFGLKEPIYSSYHLSLCDPKTLLMVRSESTSKFLLLQKVLKGANDTTFEVTFEENDEDKKDLTYDQILDLIEDGDTCLFYFPGVEVDSLHSLMEKQKEELQHETLHSTVEVTTVHVAEKAMHKVLEEVIGESLGHAAIESAAHFGGAVMHGAISSGVATHKTIKNKRKVKLYEKTEGLSGFSRTKYKREKTKDWSGAAVGTGASIAGGMAGMTVGTMVLPGVGTFVGGVIGGVVGSLTGNTVGKKVSGKIYDHEVHRKCALC